MVIQEDQKGNNSIDALWRHWRGAVWRRLLGESRETATEGMHQADETEMRLGYEGGRPARIRYDREVYGLLEMNKRLACVCDYTSRARWLV